jgi:hypothetical protein
LIITAMAVVALLIVLVGLAVGLMLLWAVDHSQRTRYSADRRGQGRYGRKEFF